MSPIALLDIGAEAGPSRWRFGIRLRCTPGARRLLQLAEPAHNGHASGPERGPNGLCTTSAVRADHSVFAMARAMATGHDEGTGDERTAQAHDASGRCARPVHPGRCVRPG